MLLKKDESIRSDPKPPMAKTGDQIRVLRKSLVAIIDKNKIIACPLVLIEVLLQFDFFPKIGGTERMSQGRNGLAVIVKVLLKHTKSRVEVVNLEHELLEIDQKKIPMKRYIASFLLVVAGGFTTLGLYKWMEEPGKPVIYQAESPSQVVRTSVTPAPIDFTTAAENTVNSVVHVKTAREQRGYQQMDPFHQFFFGTPRNQGPRMVQGAGSGVVISKDGYIVTNNHVVEGADEVLVTLNSNEEFSAEVVGTDPTTDLAVIKIDAKDLTPVPIANSDEIRLGQWVLAVGNPFNLTSTVTAGIISATGRNINIIRDQTAIESFIQTDAAVNPGNSGGALVNEKGELIGINTAITTHTGSFEGYSFAIPSNLVQKVVGDIVEFGTVQRAYLGVSIRDVDPNLAKAEDLRASNGVYIAEVIPNSGADEAGLEQGDVILKVDERTVSKTSELMEKIGAKRPGEKAQILVNREGDLREFTVTLKNMQNTTEILSADLSKVYQLFGADFEKVGKDEMGKYGLEGGLRIKDLQNGKLRQLGVSEGFIITRINNQVIRNLDDLSSAIADLEKGDGVLVQGIHPNGRPGYFAFGM